MVSNGNGRNGKYTAQQFIAAIPGSGGVISTIARRVGCAWNTAQRYINKHPTVQKAYQDEREAMLDMSESVVFGAIRREYSKLADPDYSGEIRTADAKWYLVTKGKDRGFTERSEISGPDKKPVELRHSGNVGVQVYIPDNGRGDRDSTTGGTTGKVPV